MEPSPEPGPARPAFIPAQPKYRGKTQFHIPPGVDYRKVAFHVAWVAGVCAVLTWGPMYYARWAGIPDKETSYMKYKREMREIRRKNMAEDEMPER